MSVSPPVRHRPRSAKVCEIGLPVLLGAAPLVFLRTVGEFENHPKAGVLQAGIILIGLYALLGGGLDGGAHRVRSSIDAAVLWFGGACMVSLLAAANVRESVPLLLHWGACVLLYFLVRGTFDGTTSAASRYFVAATVSASLVSLIGLAQAFLGLDWIPQTAPPGSTFANRNMAAHYVAICFPLELGLISIARHPRTLAVAGLGLALSTAYLLATRTHAAWLAVLLVLLLSAATARRYLTADGAVASRHKRIVAATAVLLGGLVFAAALGVGPVRTAQGPSRNLASLEVLGSDTLAQRTLYWGNALAMVRDHPLIGVGLGNFELQYPRYRRALADDWTFDEEHQLRRVHNDHLQILVELGLVGFAGWIWIFASAFRLAWSTARGPKGPIASQAFFVALGLVAFVVVAFFSFPMERAIPPAWTFALLGMTAALSGAEAAQPGRATPVPAIARWLGGVSLAVFLVVSVVISRRTLTADRLLTQGSRWAGEGNHPRAVEVLRRAGSIDPGRVDVLLELARNQAATEAWDEALETLRRALRLHPYQVNALSNAGRCCVELGRYEEAKQYFERAADLLPDSPQAFTNLGTVYRRLDEDDRAIAAYRRAIELARSDRHLPSEREESRELQPRLLLAALYVEHGRLEDAIGQYEAVLNEHPERGDIRRLLDELYAARHGS